MCNTNSYYLLHTDSPRKTSFRSNLYPFAWEPSLLFTSELRSFSQLQPWAYAGSPNVCFLFKISVRIIVFLGLDSASLPFSFSQHLSRICFCDSSFNFWSIFRAGPSNQSSSDFYICRHQTISEQISFNVWSCWVLLVSSLFYLKFDIKS